MSSDLSSLSSNISIVNKLSKIKNIVKQYLSLSIRIANDKDLISDYTNRSIQSKISNRNSYPQFRPVLLRQFKSDGRTKEKVDQLEASSNLDLEYYRRLSSDECKFTIDEIKYIIHNMNYVLELNKNIWDKEPHFVSLIVLVDNETYELRYDGVFYLEHNYNGKRINITFIKNDVVSTSTKVYLNLNESNL